MTEVNVSATVGMSMTVREMSTTVGEIEHGLGNSRVEIVMHNSA